MPGTLAVGAEDVILVQNFESYASSRPIDDGLELVLQLKTFPTSMVVIVVAVENTAPGEYFVKLNGLNGANVVGVVPEDRYLEPWEKQWYAIERLRSKGPIRLVVTAHPEVYMRCVHTHQPVLMFARRGSLGIETLRPSWDSLVAQVHKRRELEAESIVVPLESQEGF